MISKKIEYIMKKPFELRFTTEMNYMSDYILKFVLFFKSLQPELIPLLAEKLERVVFPANDKIMIKGEEGDCMFILYQGEVGIYIDDACTICVAKLSENKVFGEAAL
jgi:CRP-like cAMP-binding protein